MTTEKEHVQLQPHLHRIGSDHVNSYLVEDESGVTVIDAGLPGHWDELVAELGGMGRSLEDVRGVILTHGDSDHLGFAERARTQTGAVVYVHESDADLALGKTKKKNPSWGPFKIGPMLGFLWYAARNGGLKVTPVTQVETVRGGEVLDLPGSPRIVHIPGHSPGSIAIHVPSVDAVFVGDALTTRHVLTGVEAPQPAPFTLDPPGASASLDKLASIEAHWVLPGHGPPWDGGTAEVVRRIRSFQSV